jgi:hypothetical protein
MTAIRIAAFAGFYGDRPDAFNEALASEPDVLIGDYLAELTMLVLKKVSAKGGPGFAAGFVKDLSKHLDVIAERGIKVITNAGGLDPVGCAQAIARLCEEHRLNLKVAAVTGDNLIGRIGALRDADGQRFEHLDTGVALDVDAAQILTANAYLGAWPIVDALTAGADIIVCPRVTDASLTIGPAAWRHGWARDGWDQLAGALLAGHLVECSTQASGGNYSFFEEIDRTRIPGMPYVDIFPDGTFEIRKAPNTGGAVTVDTVKAQLLYEIGGRYYHNPDVVLDVRSIELEAKDDGVRVGKVHGRSPTAKLKVSLCYDAGWRNSMTVGLTGRGIAAKAAWVEQIIEERLGGIAAFDDANISIVGPAATGGDSYDANTAFMTITVADKDQSRVSREKFSNVLLSSVFAALPGCYFTSPPQAERQIAVQWPCFTEKRLVSQAVQIGDTMTPVAWGPVAQDESYEAEIPAEEQRSGQSVPTGSPVPLGTIFGTRSGDKGGIANLGVWARDDASWRWLEDWLTADKLRELLPEARDLTIARHVFPNLRALNFMLQGFLGDGVAACLRPDAQAKGLGEYLGARLIPFGTLGAADATNSNEKLTNGDVETAK